RSLTYGAFSFDARSLMGHSHPTLSQLWQDIRHRYRNQCQPWTTARSCPDSSWVASANGPRGPAVGTPKALETACRAPMGWGIPSRALATSLNRARLAPCGTPALRLRHTLR